MYPFRPYMLLMTLCGVFAAPGQGNPPFANANSDPKESQQVHSDFYGDPLPPGAVARLGTARLRPGNEVNSVAFSPKGDMVASAGGESVRLWDVKTGRQLRQLSDPRWVTSVAFSPDGKLIAAGGNDIVCLWDLSTGQKIRHFKMKFGGWMTLAFSPDGKVLAASSHWDFSRWEVASGKELPLKGFKAPIECFAFSPDSKKLLFSGGFAIRCCETETGKELLNLDQDEEQIKAVGFSPDGKTFASVGSKASLRLWDAETGKPIPQFQQYQITCSSFAFSRDGKTLIAGGWGISSWDVKTGKQIRGFEGHASEINSVALTPDDRLLATGGRDTIIRLWDVKTGQEIQRFGGHQGEVRAVAFSPDGSFLVSGGGFHDRAVRYWDIRRQKEFRPSRRASEVDAVEGIDSPICFLAFSPDGNTMAVGGREIILWRTGTAKEFHRFSVKEESLVCAAFSPSGKILAGGGVSLHLWSLPEGKELPKFDSFEGGISSLAFSPVDALLVSGTDGAGIRVSETATGKEVHRFQKPFKRRIPFTPDEPDAVYCVAFSPDGKTVAGGSWEYAVRLWDVSSGKEVRRLKAWDLPITSIAFTPDGKLLAVAGWDGIVHLWELLTGKEIHCFTGHQGTITSLAISSDGRLLASGSKDTNVLVWDLDGREDLPKGLPSAKEMEVLWETFGQDPTKAYLASRRLVAAPQLTVVLLKERLRHTPLVDHGKLTRLINDLDSNDFQVREMASVELAELAELAEPDLQKVLKGEPSLELRRRIEVLLKKLQDTPSSTHLRVSRSIRVLEQINTSEAKQLLQSFAERDSETQLRKEAKLALARLSRQKASER